MKPIGYEFMKGTYGPNMSESPQTMGEPQPPLELPLPPGAAPIPLPDPSVLDVPRLDVQTAIEHRRSVRHYSEEPISLEELSFLLWLTQGVKEVTRRPVTLRTVPSAGARHAFETLLSIGRVNGLQPGLYRYAAIQHALVRLNSPEGSRERIAQLCYNQNQVLTSAVTFLWVAILERMAWRYVERGYRYLHLDAGHVCQNLYLAAEPIGCGVCAIGAYNNEGLNEELELDGENQFVIYAAALGKKAPA